MAGEISRQNGRKGGKPKGYKHQLVLKDHERELLRQQILKERFRMTAAQIQHACGISYMVLRHPDGTFTRATNVAELDAGLKGGATAFEIFTQAPNVQAYTDLMNRALDKPAEQLKVTGAEDGPVELVFKWLTNTPKPAEPIDVTPKKLPATHE